MIRRALAAAALTALVLAVPAHAKPPSVLLIMTDDEAAADLQAMPNVKRLLERQGTSFSQAITSFPLCCPSRASFLTGQFAHNHGVSGNFAPSGYYGLKGRGNTLPVWLQRAGYWTSEIGKYLNGYGARNPREIPPGYSDWHGALDLSSYDYFNFTLNENGRLHTFGDKAYANSLLLLARAIEKQQIQQLSDLLGLFATLFPPGGFGTKEAKNYTNDVTGSIANRVLQSRVHSKQPFFIWWAPAAPHREDVNSQRGAPWVDPRPAPRDEAKMSRFKLPKPPSFNEADVSDKPQLIKDLPALTAATVQRLELNYQGRLGSLQAVDRGVAQLVGTLRRAGRLDDTLILFTSDNGWVQGQHRIPGDKFVPYEESIRVPLIMRGPGIPAGRVVDKQVSNVDLTPTLLDVAGGKPGRRMDGLSLLPFARDPAHAPERALPIEATGKLFAAEGFPQAYDTPYSGLRTARWKYVRWSYGDRELYDLRKDPYEMTNLAADPRYASTVKRLEAERHRLAHCRGAACNAQR